MESIIDLLGKERDKIKFHGLTFQNLIMKMTIC